MFGRRGIAAAIAVVALAAALAFKAEANATEVSPLKGPCDIYAAGGTPCVAAHSTTRALSGTYSGSLYRVRRASDNSSLDIKTMAAGGFADAAAQDTFCARTTCVITEIYDQSGKHNDLTVAPAGHAGIADNPAPADALPVTAGGHTVYGVSMSGVMGYRNNATHGVPTGSQAEGIYLVTSGTHYNDKCCFDYGNAEPSNTDTGPGHMDALYFGTSCWFKPCRDGAPRVMADFEDGLYQSDTGESKNASYAGNPTPFVTAMLKNNGTDHFALRDGNAQSGPLETQFDGKLPPYPGYAPQKKEGAIILGIGGDNSNGSAGSFFEGVLTAGQPSNVTEEAVQANIVAVGYGAPSPTAPGTLDAGSTISLRVTTPGYTDRYLRHSAGAAVTSVLTAASPAADKSSGSWIVRPGLADPSCVSFESRDYPGDFLRHQNFVVLRMPMDGTSLFRADATFCPVPGKSGPGTSFATYRDPNRFLRHYNSSLYISANGGPNPFDNPFAWPADVTWSLTKPLTP